MRRYLVPMVVFTITIFTLFTYPRFLGGILILLGVIGLLRIFADTLWYRRLPIATLVVDGHTLSFRYDRQRALTSKFYAGKLSTDQYALIFAASSVAGKFHESPGVVSPVQVAAVLSFQDQTIEFSMGKERATCHCPVPHWSGMAYGGMFTSGKDDSFLEGVIGLVILDEGDKKDHKVPQKRKFRLKFPQMIPEFNPT